MKKKGISLVVLVISVMVLGILATTVTVSVANSLASSRMTAFAEDLSTIQGAVELYLVENGVLPYEGTGVTASSLASLAGSNSAKLSAEIAENGDSNSKFYIVDLSKLGITQSARGLKANGIADVYYVNDRGTKVYYPIGVSISGTKYFSLTKALAGVTTIPNPDDTGSGVGTGITIVGTEGSISLSKSLNTWTNNLVVNVYTYLESGETVKYTVGNSTSEKTVASNMKITLNKNTLTASEISGLATNEMLTVKKYSSSGSVVAVSQINIGNLDCTAPEISGSSIVYGSEFNLISFSSLSDTGSGVKELRYDWVTRVNSTGQEESNTEVSTESIVSYGVSAQSTLIIDTNITKMGVVVIDNAGNYSTMLTLNIHLTINAKTLPSMASELYGKVVTNYTTGDTTIDQALATCDIKWKVFHSDGENIFLITSDYIPVGSTSATADANVSGLPMVTSFSYGAVKADSYFSGVQFILNMVYAQGTDLITDLRIRNLNKKFFDYIQANNISINSDHGIKLFGYLLDITSNVWGRYSNSKYSEYAIGSPTIEMFVDSYNLKNKKSIVYTANEEGYVWLGKTIVNDELYVIPKSPASIAKGLALSTWATGGLVVIDTLNSFSGQIDYIMFDEAGYGLRPVVCLKSSVILEESGTGLVIKN